MKRALSVIVCLSVLLCAAAVADVPAREQFTWWINKTDGQGTFYSVYEENPGVQWLNTQYWGENGPTDAAHGTQLRFSFQTPIIGSERDNFSTMISTEEYPEIIDLSYSDASPLQLYEDEVLMEITKYVEAYMPNYKALLDANPSVKALTTFKGKNGSSRYFALYGIADDIIDPFEGYMYRRDWVVKYAAPTEYVWDWESQYVKDNGHPLYTPLARAVEEGDMTGWKTNPVNVFTSEDGDDPNNTYADNVIFPSGLSDPYTISDWEWMLDAFKKALADEGMTGVNAYPLSVYYPGYLATGDLVSSFGGGTCSWYIDADGNAVDGTTGNTFYTYLQCMHEWYTRGYIDTRFETRSSDMFYKINTTGYSQGTVGMWQGAIAMLGTTIRATACTEYGRQHAMIFGCSLPINDVYGEEHNKFVKPDCLYQQNILGTPTGFTVKCEGKDMETLFRFLDWKYTREGALITGTGLTAELLADIKLDPDLYAEYGITSAFYIDEDGIVQRAVSTSEDLSKAIACGRMACGLQVLTNVNKDLSAVTTHALEQWKKYVATGYISDYNSLMNEKQSALYTKLQAYLKDYMEQTVPGMIKDGLDKWDTYEKKVKKFGGDKLTKVYQEILDSVK